MSMMFATLLDGRVEDSFEIYHSFFELSVRNRVFDVMAEKRLSAELKGEIALFFQSVRAGSKIRNFVAHGFWGASDSHPDCILLQDGSHSTRLMIRESNKLLRPGPKDDEIDTDIKKGMKLQRFYIDDFTEYLERIDKLSRESLRLGLKIALEVRANAKRRDATGLAPPSADEHL